MIELDTLKTYEWFLAEIGPAKKASGPKLRLAWTCVTENITITEICGITKDGKYGPRLTELAQRLGLPSPDNILKGMHMWASVQRHWTKEQHEDFIYELTYESLSALPPSDQLIDEATRKKVEFFVRQSKSWDEARSRVKERAPNLLAVFEKLKKSGELALAS
jgi:hypothetical protein